MPHPFAADTRSGNFNPAAFANNAPIADTSIFTAMALPVFDWSKNLFAKQTAALRLESPIINGLGLFNLAVRPFLYLFGRGQTDLDKGKFLVLDFLKRHLCLLRLTGQIFAEFFPPPVCLLHRYL